MLLDLLSKRRSIRQFTAAPLSSEHIDHLKEIAIRVPTSRGLNPWQFNFVTQSDLISKLAQAKPHAAAFLDQCPLAVVISADTCRSDVWIEDSSIAAICLQLAATELDLASCWVQIRLRPHDETTTASDYVSSLLNLGEHHQVVAIIGIGHPAEKKVPHPKQDLPWKHIVDFT